MPSTHMGPTEVKNLQSCHWVMYLRNWKHQFGVSGFHHSHSKILSLSDENKIRKSIQTKKIMWVPRFFIIELWVSSDITQNRPKPNRPLTSFSICKIASNTKMTHIEFKFMWPNKYFRAWLIGGFFIFFFKTM